MDLSEFSPSSTLITVILIGIAPFAIVMVTSFAKIVVVLSLLRNALGVQQVPPNLVLNGLAMILTIYVMYPVGMRMVEVSGGVNQSLDSTEQLVGTVNRAKEPLRNFLLKHTGEAEREFFLDTILTIADPDQQDRFSTDDFVIIVPAFTISELTAAFQLGFLIFLPFLVIDLIIANILMAMGMSMLSPTIVSLPFKLLLFVLVEGWVKLALGLVLSYS
jgi:type III secretion protein R